MILRGREKKCRWQSCNVVLKYCPVGFVTGRSCCRTDLLLLRGFLTYGAFSSNFSEGYVFQPGGRIIFIRSTRMPPGCTLNK